jgi:sulfhydrogenase subunit beta (sulfur reductase)
MMMTDKVLSKDKISEFVDRLSGKYTVVAPVRREKAPAEFREVTGQDSVVIDGSVSLMPPKDYFLPRYEKLMSVTTKDGQVQIDAPLPEAIPRVMLGVWLPDAKALDVLDKIFLDEKFKDPYYAARRENTIVVAIVPEKPRWSWFCTSVDDVTTWKSRADIVSYDLGDSLYFEPIADRGSAMLDEAGLSEPTDDQKAAKERIWTAFVEVPHCAFAGKDLYDNLCWDSPVWDDIAQRCVSCGACTYMCPSCSCFDVQDATCGGCVERYRCRDTCQFEDFTLMGAGHNPREQKVPRARQRLMHKFKYQREQFGITACTGCGRCVELCPVNIDIRDALCTVCSSEIETPAEA